MEQGFTQITNEDRTGKGVSGLPDTPNMTASELQARFDSLANLSIDAFNRLVNELGLDSAASKIGTASGSLQSWISAEEQKQTKNETDISNISDRVTSLEISSGTGEGESSDTFLALKNTVLQNTENITVNDQRISDAERDITNLEERVVTFTDVSVLSSAWKADTTYTDYPYVAEISLSNVDKNFIPNVIFDLEDAQSGSFAPVSKTSKNVVKIFANEQVSKDITIPTIQCIRER